MKNKYKIFNVLFIFICTFFVINLYAIPNVLAKDLEEPIKKPKNGCCLFDGDKYPEALSVYRPLVDFPWHFPSAGDGDYFTVQVASGKFEVYIYEVVDGIKHKEPPIRHFSLSGGQQETVHFKLKALPQDWAIVFVLAKGDKRCTVSESTVPVQKPDGTWTTADDNGFIFYYHLGLPSLPGVTEIDNLNYNGICSLINGKGGNFNTYKKYFDSTHLDFATFEKYKNQINFPYCSKTRVNYNYSVREVAQIIRNKIKGVEIANLYAQQPPINVAPGALIVNGDTNFKDKNTPLRCPAYQNVNGLVLPNKSYSTKKYYKKETTSKDVNIYTSVPGVDGKCVETCEENLTVTYGPPVASKAGLCFEYKVKVESKVNCNSKFTVPEPNPEDYKICTPTGSCNGGAYHSASGPNDEFDSCVKKCDGGKYSQKCIDKCYSKIYEKNITNKKLNVEKMGSYKGYNSENIKELDPALLKLYNDIIASGPDAIGVGNGKKYTYEQLKIALTEAGTGFYSVNNGRVIWNTGKERYWELPGAYYTLNITPYTVSRLQNAGRCNTTHFTEYGHQCGISLIDTGSGLLRNNSGTGYCGAACEWYGCDTARKNKYYVGYPKTKGQASNRSFLNAADAIDVYKQEFEKYEAAAIECNSKARCSTKTAEYTIKVNNKTKDKPDEDNWIDYKSSIKGEGGFRNGSTVNGKPLGNSSIILDRNGCYLDGQAESEWYLTEWSFPGTWINNKTGKISYSVPSNDNAWHKKKDKFCTNLNSKNVNEEWWNHRVLHENENITNLANIDEYNIKASVSDFGYFDWSFDMECFYALNQKKIGPPDTDKPGDIDFKIRNIKLNDMFPDNVEEEDTTDPNKTGRTPGYNWTNGATNVKNKDYIISPEPLYQEIQKRGTSIYSATNADKYLDYEFVLSPNDLNTIRKYSKSLGNNYSKYGGKISVNNGVAYYESNLFRGSSYLDSSSALKLGKLGVNNQADNSSNDSEIFTNDYVNSLIDSRKDYLNSLGGK